MGRKENTNRPPPLPRLHLPRRHINLIDVRPLFAIYLDADKQPIHLRGHNFVLEALPLHYVAPVTGRIANGKKDRLVLAPSLLKRLRAPGIPVNRVVSVLEQIGRGLVDKAVWMLTRNWLRH